MKLMFLGTAAADFSKRLLTDCKDRFDKDARRASCLLIGEHYLVDCGPHAIDSLKIAGADICAITDLFLTHLHSDHFSPENIEEIAAAKKDPLRIWVRQDAILPEIPNTETIRMPFQTLMSIADGITVETVDANHDQEFYPQHFIFTVNGKQLLYALDGGWFLNGSYKYLHNRNIDMAVLDATCGDYAGDYRAGEHNSIPMIRLLVPSLKTWGAINDSTRIYLSHLAPRLHKPHEETQAIVEKDGLIVAYDGLATEL